MKANIIKRLIVVVAIILCILVNVIIVYKCSNLTPRREVVDTINVTYDCKPFDSVAVRIIEKDSVVHKLKVNMEYEVKQIYIDNDSIAIARFLELTSGNEL